MRAKLTVIAGPSAGKSLELAGRHSGLIGKSPGADLELQDEGIDAFQAMLEVSPSAVLLRDLTSGRTEVNGRPIPPVGSLLSPGDTIKLGTALLRFERLADPHSATQLEVALDATMAQSRAPSEPPRTDRLVTVRCSACGERSALQESATEVQGVAYFCADCQQELSERPPSLPGYRVLRELGRGGMGVVYLAEHESGELRVLKQLLPEAAVRERNRQLFVREARKQAGLKHPNIVELYDFVEPEPGIFVAIIEYVDGLSCDALAERKGGKLAPGEAATVVERALLGLSFMHQRGLVHRDLKESNILVSLSTRGQIEQVKIADFGLAKSFQDSGASMMLTKTGQVGGTLPYMAPEQIRNFRDTRPAADLYSMGVTLYRLLSGAYPHDYPEGRHPYLVALADPRVPLERRSPGLPPALVAVVERALEPAPEARFADADEMRAALLAAAEGAS